jgi:2-polyprenyl-3-methyl-5-hydroxy-6-metoxy-1,4-benzoquinol methylase
MLKRIFKRLNRFRNTVDMETDAGSYWGLSDREDRIQDQSHWCGVMRWNRERWHAYGDFHVDLILNRLERFAGPDYIKNLHLRTALEWGCGGGAIVRPLCGCFSTVYGTEISPSSLTECARQMRQFGFSNFRGIHFNAPDPESVLQKMAGQSVDVFISAGVFQHFPSKPYTARVLKVMGALAKPDACVLLQVRYFDGSERLRQKENDYARNVIYMTSFTPEHFSPLLDEAGFIILQRDRDLDGGTDCHDYYFLRKKSL